MRVAITLTLDVADHYVADDFVAGLNCIMPYAGDNVVVTWVEVTE